MVNWTEIAETYPNFTSKLQKKWETKGFTAEETKEWIEGFGLKPEESDFADWLKKKHNVTAEEYLDDDDKEELRERYKKELEEEGVVEEDNINSSNEFANEEENGKQLVFSGIRRGGIHGTHEKDHHGIHIRQYKCSYPSIIVLSIFHNRESSQCFQERKD